MNILCGPVKLDKKLKAKAVRKATLVYSAYLEWEDFYSRNGSTEEAWDTEAEYQKFQERHPELANVPLDAVQLWIEFPADRGKATVDALYRAWNTKALDGLEKFVPPEGNYALATVEGYTHLEEEPRSGNIGPLFHDALSLGILDIVGICPLPKENAAR